jgi:Tfp pilus assembly protein PilV
MQKNKKHTQSGFGLVEVLVSITLIVLVIVTFNQLSLYAFRNWENAQNKSIAYNLIQSTIENLHDQRNINLNTEDLAWSNGIVNITNSSSTVNGKNYTVSTSVEDIPVPLNPNSKKKVTVTVNWTERAGPKSLTSVTYLTDWKGKY